ncbi:MAG: hypothetical protein Q7T71_01345, partial [Herbiconiux sp.]|nr:hypothetical protein [Herbiconiux sp.]
MTTTFGSTPVLDDSVRVEGTTVQILDRRVFPETASWVAARDAEQVAEAIRSMVTQSSGPLFAAYAGLEITALQVAGLAPDAALARLAEAGAALAGARPTNGHPREAEGKRRVGIVAHHRHAGRIDKDQRRDALGMLQRIKRR